MSYLMSKTRAIIFGIVSAIVAAASTAVPAPIDTTPPSFTWISPQEFSILTTNTIRLCVDAFDNEGGSGIEKVRFFVRYYDSNDRMSGRKFIGEVETHPYEYVWDCSDVPDQNLGKLQFYCEVSDNAGNSTVVPNQTFEFGYPQLVLDRTRALKDTRFISHYTRKKITVDGDLREWTTPDSIVFYNNDNTIAAYSQWNKKYLYIAVRVTGRSLISHYPPGSDNIIGMALEDELEFFFDTNHDHHEIFSFPDRHYLIAAAGMAIERKITLDNGYRSELLINPSVDVKVKIDGTLNDESDEDNCYTMEFAISWKELGFTPDKNASMGIEIWNNDKDYVDGSYFFSGWSTNASNLSNPSEWGNLVLVKKDSPLVKAFAVSGIMILLAAAGIFLRYRYRMASAPTDSPAVDENEYIRKAKLYVEEHYADEELSRECVAPDVGLTSSYFGKVFKQETGMNFADYVTDFRIGKAKTLLAATHKNVSEIALEVGFSSQSYFTYQFKKRVDKSPTEYRAEAWKKQSSLKS